MTRKITLPEPWKSLAVKMGGVGKLADYLGVAPNTLYRWAHGKHKVPGPAKVLLAQMGLILGLLLAFAMPCRAAEPTSPWTTTDKVIEGVFVTTMVIDWRQTSTWHDPGCYEHNFILGQHPSQAKINAYFILATLGHVYVADKLHGWQRTLWQGLWIGAELKNGATNYSIGMHCRI